MTRGGVKERGQGTGSRRGFKEGVQGGGSRREGTRRGVDVRMLCVAGSDPPPSRMTELYLRDSRAERLK